MKNKTYICENCGCIHNGNYGSGRFCSLHCRKSYCSKQQKHHECHFNIIPEEQSKKLLEINDYICPKCNKHLHCNKSQYFNHIRWCNIDENGNKKPKFMKINIDEIDWNKLQREYDECHSWEKVIKDNNLSRNIINYGKSINKLSKNKLQIVSNELKNKLSEKRKEWLHNNPDKHVWKRNTKFISTPCEEFKQKLLENNISFISEYTPLEDRFYSIDIAFPNNKIGIEINGNQHYNRDGTLKDYYQERHNLIENNGWKLYEIPFIKVYDKDFIDNFIFELKLKINTTEKIMNSI